LFTRETCGTKNLKKIEFVLFGLIYYIFTLILRSKTIIIMPNANSVRSSSSNNQNMAINQEDFLRSISGGDGICARELYNNINNQNMEINQESIARELYNYFTPLHI